MRVGAGVKVAVGGMGEGVEVGGERVEVGTTVSLLVQAPIKSGTKMKVRSHVNPLILCIVMFAPFMCGEGKKFDVFLRPLLEGQQLKAPTVSDENPCCDQHHYNPSPTGDEDKRGV